MENAFMRHLFTVRPPFTVRQVVSPGIPCVQYKVQNGSVFSERNGVNIGGSPEGERPSQRRQGHEGMASMGCKA